MKRFTVLSDVYLKKFGFPFIRDLKNATNGTILASLEASLKNSRNAELSATANVIDKIAWARLLERVETAKTGFLTCHVLDTAHGTPAAGMRVSLRRLSPAQGPIGNFVTNSD